MGGTTFTVFGTGKTAGEAFSALCDEARYEHGHRGYTGTIAEKHEFVMIEIPAAEKDAYRTLVLRDLPGIGGPALERKIAERFAGSLIDKGDPRVDDKWGPAAAIAIGDGSFLFFGWASC